MGLVADWSQSQWRINELVNEYFLFFSAVNLGIRLTKGVQVHCGENFILRHQRRQIKGERTVFVE